MKTAMIYDWLVTIGGGERTLSAIAELYKAPIYTLVSNLKGLKGSSLKDADIRTSFLQKLPFASTSYRYYLPLFPLAVEQFDLSQYDLILSTSHAVAKGALTQPHQLHLCYCFTPMRYAWDLTHRYLEGTGKAQRMMARPALHYLRNWDIASLNRVDHFAAISHYIARRIKKTYGREATVIYPPVDTDLITMQPKKEDYFLTISRMVPYKKIDLIVEAFSQRPDKKLIVIGDGPEMSKIKKKAAKNIEILGHQPDHIVRKHMEDAKAFVFAAEEDFGIVVIEAQAAGTPVIAFGRGASLETVVDQKTGLFFKEQTVSSLLETLDAFERSEFNPESIRSHALQFCKERFQREFKEYVEKKIEEHHESRHFSRR